MLLEELIRCFKSEAAKRICSECLSSSTSNENSFCDNITRSCPRLENLLKNNGIKVIHLNVRGLAHNFGKLDEIFTSFQNIAIFGVTETHMNKDLNSNVKIRRFNYIDKPRTNGAGSEVGDYSSERIEFITTIRP